MGDGDVPGEIPFLCIYSIVAFNQGLLVYVTMVTVSNVTKTILQTKHQTQQQLVTAVMMKPIKLEEEGGKSEGIKDWMSKLIS